MKCVELFAGAGGMAIGLHRAGFRHVALIESDAASFATLVANGKSYGHEADLILEDVRAVDFRPYGGVDLLAAGAPCQPWSRAGKGLLERDERNLLPEVLRAQRELMPKAVVIENVGGLASAGNGNFFLQLKRSLEFPMAWHEGSTPLSAGSDRANIDLTTSVDEVTYGVSLGLLQAADYGVPQIRSRVFLVAIRRDVGGLWSPPIATHSRDALVRRLSGVSKSEHENGKRPWVTVQDAISDLPSPTSGEIVRPSWHFHRPGARAYDGHTGSRLNWPAKTLKAGVHGVAGGENMLRLRNGRMRYFTIREAARLQTFPDTHEFMGTWSDAVRQVGNAVPVMLARAVGRSLAEVLQSQEEATRVSEHTIESSVPVSSTRLVEHVGL